MTLITAFAVVLGVPAALAVLLYAAPIRRSTKAALFASVPGGLALLLYLPNYTLADVGAVGLVVVPGSSASFSLRCRSVLGGSEEPP
jgi:hypothetical protein